MEVQAKSILSGRSLQYWRIAQILVGIIGLGIFFALIFFPEIGIHAFWNVLIPVAPALFVVAVGLWRNVCPLASTSLISRHLGLARNKKLKPKQQARLQLISVILLLLIVPLRHTIFDTNGPATALIISVLALIALYISFRYDWKSAWCSGLCPIHPVEKLYGRKSLFVLPNAHCKSCVKCVNPCPDSTPSIHPLTKKNKTLSLKIAGTLIIGGFPGFIWGWFHVQDYYNNEGWEHLILTYSYPIVAMLITLILFIVIKKIIINKYEILLINIFATAAVSIYYWYRLPALIGFGIIPGDGMLVDLTEYLPYWSPILLQILTTLFFAWWIILNKKETASWVIRPPYIKQK
ncbi:MAG: ferredoxin [Bacteroidetes bacterium]|nr:MAG: ferredoxin [Bacteroidota bacterium]